jgi:arsenite methyltransferase
VHRSLLTLLVDPETKEPLGLASEAEVRGDEIVEGSLRSRNGREYPITRGIPRFVATSGDAGQEQTGESFGYKWRRQRTFDRAETQSWAREWLLERYGFAGVDELRRHFASAGRVLDAGCGSGYTAGLWMEPGWSGGSAEWYGIDYSEAIDVARERVGGAENSHFIQADVNRLPFPEGTFGAAFAEGVLHHTPSTEQAFGALAAAVRPGGELLVYIYRRKGPIREFSDDFLRDELAPLAPDEALARLRPLTELARTLASVEGRVVVTEPIPALGIEAGEYSVQRFVYWHFLKAFWNDAFSFEANNLVNFDWYHPRYAHRHSEDELRAWCERLGLAVRRFDVQESGFTQRALKPDPREVQPVPVLERTRA